MKKSVLFLAASAMMALTACTSESVVEEVKSARAIGFENVVNKPTRADITSSFLKQFNVYGFYTTPGNDQLAVSVFEDVKVTRSNTGAWVYEDVENNVPLRYWVPGAHYYFYAYNCGNADKLSTAYGSFTMNMTDNIAASQRTLKINNYVCDNSHQHDLIYASNTGATEENPFAGIVGKANGNALVSLQFNHLLSKVQAQFTSKLPADYTVKISDVKISSIENVASYDPDPEVGWTGQTHPEGTNPSVTLLSALASDIISTTVDEDPATTGSAYVIPCKYSGTEGLEDSWVYITFMLTLENKKEPVYTRLVTGKFSPTWLAGHAYTYNIEISGSNVGLQVIGFTVDSENAVGGWGNGKDDTTITLD